MFTESRPVHIAHTREHLLKFMGHTIRRYSTERTIGDGTAEVWIESKSEATRLLFLLRA